MEIIKIIYLNHLKIIAIINFICIYSFAFSQKITTTEFSPYSELTEYLDKTEKESLLHILQEQNIKIIIFAFIQDAGKCLPAWDGLKVNSIHQESIINLANSIKKHNISYHISFGGQSGHDLALHCKDANALFHAYEKVIKIYEPRGLDFDLEGLILKNNFALKKMLTALKKIEQFYPQLKITITVPVMPYGLETNEKALLKNLKRQKLNYNLNLLTMNYSLLHNKNMFNYTELALKNTASFLNNIYKNKETMTIYKNISVTQMIGETDIPTEFFTQNDAQKLVDIAKKLELYSIHFWSLERDKPCTKKVNLKICSGISHQKYYEYTNIFNKINN